MELLLHWKSHGILSACSSVKQTSDVLFTLGELLTFFFQFFFLQMSKTSCIPTNICIKSIINLSSIFFLTDELFYDELTLHSALVTSWPLT